METMDAPGWSRYDCGQHHSQTEAYRMRASSGSAVMIKLVGVLPHKIETLLMVFGQVSRIPNWWTALTECKEISRPSVLRRVGYGKVPNLSPITHKTRDVMFLGCKFASSDSNYRALSRQSLRVTYHAPCLLTRW